MRQGFGVLGRGRNAGRASVETAHQSAKKLLVHPTRPWRSYGERCRTIHRCGRVDPLRGTVPGRTVLTLYYAPRTRAVRAAGCSRARGAARLRRVTFVPPPVASSRRRRRSEFPVLVDGDVTIFSQRHRQYVLERYGRPVGTGSGSPLRGRFSVAALAGATAFPPLRTIVTARHSTSRTRRRSDVVEDARTRPHHARVAGTLAGGSALVVRVLGSRRDARLHARSGENARRVDASLPNLTAYLERLEARPAFRRATAD